MTTTGSRSPRLTPDRIVIALLAVEAFLLLSQWFRWFTFNQNKGWAVLIAVAAVALTLLSLSLWFVGALIFRWRFQYSLRSLLLLTAAAAIACSWLTTAIEQARRQREAIAAILKARAGVFYDLSEARIVTPSPPPLETLLGTDFFRDVAGVQNHKHSTRFADADLERVAELKSLLSLRLRCSRVTDDGLKYVARLPQLTELSLSDTSITDAGLEHLTGLSRLKYLTLSRTNVTDAGAKRLQEALPKCTIIR
ncbi:MAG: hypothetical protein ABFC96_15320 [Thermoguttaceae bacterium]